jgi:hypothetical protein
VLGAIGQAVGGIAAGFERLDRAAGRIARDGAGGDLTATMVDQMRARHDVGANLAVIRTADDMIGRLIDVFA